MKHNVWRKEKQKRLVASDACCIRHVTSNCRSIEHVNTQTTTPTVSILYPSSGPCPIFPSILPRIQTHLRSKDPQTNRLPRTIPHFSRKQPRIRILNRASINSDNEIKPRLQGNFLIRVA